MEWDSEDTIPEQQYDLKNHQAMEIYNWMDGLCELPELSRPGYAMDMHTIAVCLG